MKNKNIILWILVILLTFTFSFTFIKNTSKDNRKAQKTALLNPKYKDTIKNIILYDASNAIELNYNGQFWTINNPTDSENKIPADNQKVISFLEQLIKVRDLYKISDSLNENNNLGFDNNNSFHIVYYTDDENQKYSDLIFGNHDFTQQYRYFMTDKAESVYEIDTSLDSFLSSKIASWNEGFIISKNIIKSDDIQKVTINDFIENKSITLSSKNENFTSYILKLLELRQGGIPEEKILENSLINIKVAFGNLDELNLSVYSSKTEGEYLLKENYQLYNSKSYEYVTKISSWTFSKLKLQ